MLMRLSGKCTSSGHSLFTRIKAGPNHGFTTTSVRDVDAGSRVKYRIKLNDYFEEVGYDPGKSDRYGRANQL